MKLENVAVKLTEKNIGKVCDILKMFGEDIYSETKERLENSMLSDVFNFIHFSDANHWTGLSGYTEKALIKPSQLKQLLAKERLKGGDVIVVCNSDETVIAELNCVIPDDEIFGGEFMAADTIDIYTKNRGSAGVFEKFIRFATEKEKALLKPKPEKKELEVGKWYKYTDSNNEYKLPIIANFQGTQEDSNYGFDFLGIWCEDITLYHYKLGKEITEATHEEVEQALIKEAKKRNIIEGFHIVDLNNVSIVPNGEYVYSNGTLYLGGATIFKDGEWASNGEWDFKAVSTNALKTMHDNFKDKIMKESENNQELVAEKGEEKGICCRHNIQDKFDALNLASRTKQVDGNEHTPESLVQGAACIMNFLKED